MSKRIIAIFVCAAMLVTMCGFTASASSAENALNRIADKAVNAIVGGIASIIRAPGWKWQGKEDTTGFMPGMAASEFADEAANSAKWSIGYASRSLQTGDELDGNHYVGGSLSVSRKVATAILDDQRVRTAAVSDGRNIVIFASLDAYGFANPDVRDIRASLADYAKEKGIISINISALHQHSCVDTFGMNGDILKAFFLAPIKNLLGLGIESGKNPEYMANLKKQVIDSIKSAVADMTTGTLYYGTVNVKDYIRDKRDPQVFDENLNRFRFVPDDSSEETWLVNGAIHCVGNGAAGTTVTGDYPYYMEEYIKQNAGNANLVYIQGAELAITSKDGDSKAQQADIDKFGERYASLMAYGRKLGEKLCSISSNDEQLVSPILNVAHKRFYVPIENNILVLAGKCGLLSNCVVRTGCCKYAVSTELGYLELGDSIAIGIIPGELAPDIAYGGVMSADESWTGTSWDYPSMKELAGSKKLLVFGITNDQIGYILADNSWHSYFTENEEIVAIGSKAGSTVISEYKSFVETF